MALLLQILCFNLSMLWDDYWLYCLYRFWTTARVLSVVFEAVNIFSWSLKTINRLNS